MADASAAPPEEHRQHNKRPTNSKFKQQKLPAWKPILTPKTVLPNVFGIGIIFIAVGIALLVASNSVKEQEWDYTNCQSTNFAGSCAALLESDPRFTNFSEVCTCRLDVDLTEGFDGDETYIYYALDKFYQNHREYVRSRWDAQLRSVTAIGNEECDPLNTAEDGRTFAPCGLIANSLFNDTILFFRCNDPACTTRTRVDATGQDITWRSDRNTKFRNPGFPSGGDLCDAGAFDNTSFVPPPNWPVRACQLGQSIADVGQFFAHSTDFNSSGRGYVNEDLIVWMRTAALPNFRKLYRRVVNTALPNGKYQVDINYNYPVANFKGRKKVVLSTVAWNGGRNPFLGIAYLVVGCLCLGAVVVFSVLVRMKPRQLGQPENPTWN